MKICFKYLVISISLLTASNAFSQVGIGTNTPAASAALEVTSDIVSYNWTNTTGLSATTISNPEAKPKATTTYSVEVTNRLVVKPRCRLR